MEQMCMRFFLMRVNFFFQMHHYVQEAVLIRTNDYSFSIFFIRVREKDLVRFFFYSKKETTYHNFYLLNF